jgi:hypothetical protein
VTGPVRNRDDVAAAFGAVALAIRADVLPVPMIDPGAVRG